MPSPTLTPADIQIVLDLPALTPPSGETSNFDHPESIAIYAYITVGLGIFFTTLAVLMRIYTKAFIVKMFSWEDCTVILGWLMYIGICVPVIIGCQFDGAHQWNVRLGDLFKVLYYTYTVQVMYGPVIFVVKVPILLQYRRIFVPSAVSNRFMHWGIHIILWSNFLIYFIDTVLQIIACRPIAFFWNKLLEGTCFNTQASAIATASFNSISDFAMLLLPMHSIWKLQLPRSKKLGISALFGTGLLACASSAARMVYCIRLLITGDVTFYSVAVAAWAMAEIAFGILCSCLPIAPKFVGRVGPKLHSLFSTFINVLSLKSQPATTTATSDLSRKAEKGKTSNGVNPYNSRKKPNGNSREYPLDTWELIQTNREEYTVEITGTNLKTSEVELINDRQIIQTSNFDIESFEQKDSKTDTILSWRQA